jgi:hypothetical protein
MLKDSRICCRTAGELQPCQAQGRYGAVSGASHTSLVTTRPSSLVHVDAGFFLVRLMCPFITSDMRVSQV